MPIKTKEFASLLVAAVAAIVVICRCIEVSEENDYSE